MSIEVANGTGTAGQAGQMSQLLAGLGYQQHASRRPPGTATPRPRSATRRTRSRPPRQVAARIPGGAHPGRGARPDADALQPGGHHRIQLHRLDGGRLGLDGFDQPVDELDSHHPAGHQQRGVSAARHPGGADDAALLTEPVA